MQATVDLGKAVDIKGWMTLEELLWLATTASRCNLIVEFGSYHGRSTRALADNMRSNGRLWAVDPWNGDYPGENGEVMDNVNTYCFPQFRKNLEDHILCGRVVPHRGFSYSFRLPFQVDMVFIDGDHRYEVVHKDISKAIELTKPGGIICGHDYGFFGVKQAVDERFNNVAVTETIWWTTKS
jgi:predicted O-methyltransferase YrrM